MGEALISRRGGSPGEYKIFGGNFYRESTDSNYYYFSGASGQDFSKGKYIVHLVMKSGGGNIYAHTYRIKNGVVTKIKEQPESSVKSYVFIKMHNGKGDLRAQTDSESYSIPSSFVLVYK